MSEEDDPLAGFHRLERDPFYEREIEVEVEAALDEMRQQRTRLDMGLIKRTVKESLNLSAVEARELTDDDLVQLILKTTVLRLDSRGIHVIQNLEMFGGVLTELYLQYNSISTMENLESLTGLKILALHGNRIQKVEGVEHMSHLEYLNLSENQVSELDVDALPESLEALDISDNPLQMDADLREDIIIALPELLMLNNKRIKHRFKQLFDIVGTSADDSLAAGMYAIDGATCGELCRLGNVLKFVECFRWLWWRD